ncbi:hypothetical protein ACFLYU_00005 [Candidatus Dependentiae bacterium]
MKRITFIGLFVVTHLFFIFFQINKHNQIITLSYAKQTYENEIKELTEKKQELSQNWYHLRKRSTIKQFAKDTLNMSKVKLKQVKKIELAKLENNKKLEK